MTLSWPVSGSLDLDRTALVVIDMQTDFCGPGGWIDRLGQSFDNTRKPIGPIADLLAAARAAGMTIIHTREGHRPDLTDLNPVKRWRSRVHGVGIGDESNQGRALTRGDPGHDIIPELYPETGEIVIDKPGKSSFHATEFDQVLRARGIEALIVCGVTSDCCVQSTIRDGADLGYDCVLVVDGTAAVESANHQGMVDVLSAYGGRWGAVMPSSSLVAMIEGAGQ
ncbi:cysteine hydrolase [Kaistia dalseonensis]|uniref:Nicotinamidase-related amidase n=1 Tax=Kaistia dalseonensis TaxID=410840 RepID=A0ABU0HDL8_9HYPH|nr:cysteine hydrolase [Kaistia dalseonensis]MCX5497194.1 cysteine hydrolase [Kaistia dalseonensis]MDQ0439825.1 nicotinamidase-related amidase [Kaistia dalseonensis]